MRSIERNARGNIPLLAGTGVGDTALVNNEVSRKAALLEMGGQAGGIVALIPAVAPLGVVLTDDGVKGVVVGDVGGETTNLVLLAGSLVGSLQDLGELIGSEGKVVVPPEPATVGGVNVEVDVVLLELGDGMGDAITVGVNGTGAEGDVEVGDQVSERIGLEDNGELEVLGGGDLLGVGLDELLLVALKAVLAAQELTGGLASGAISIGEVVKDETDDLLLAGRLLDTAGGGDGLVDSGELRETGDPDEGADLLGLKGAESVLDIALLEEALVGLSELVGPLGVDELGLANEGVGDVALGRGGLLGGGRDGSHEGAGGQSGNQDVGTHGDGRSKKKAGWSGRQSWRGWLKKQERLPHLEVVVGCLLYQFTWLAPPGFPSESVRHDSPLPPLAKLQRPGCRRVSRRRRRRRAGTMDRVGDGPLGTTHRAGRLRSWPGVRLPVALPKIRFLHVPKRKHRNIA